MHPTVGLWVIGVALIIASWYIPNGFGYEMLGVLAIIAGTVMGLMSR